MKITKKNFEFVIKFKTFLSGCNQGNKWKSGSQLEQETPCSCNKNSRGEIYNWVKVCRRVFNSSDTEFCYDFC